MSYSVEYRKIPSGDKIHSLNVKVYIPDGEKKGILQISHGMTEHIERYDDFMGFMAENGFVCVAHDHLGHGKTVRGDDELGFIASKDGWRIMVEDVFTVGSAIKAEYPALRMVLLGHSMGSFIARLTAFYHPYSYNALIIMGTGAKNSAAEAGIALTTAIAAAKGEKYVSKKVDDMAFGSFGKKFEGETPYDWLTRDKEKISKYAEDKYCTFKFTVSAMRDLMTLNKNANSREWFRHMAISGIPIFLVSGSMDPVGDYGAGVTKIYETLRKAGARDLTIKLYEGARHEILNETCRDTVYRDILSWMTKRV